MLANETDFPGTRPRLKERKAHRTRLLLPSVFALWGRSRVDLVIG